MQSSLSTFYNQNSVFTMFFSYNIVNKNTQRYCVYQEEAIYINRNKIFTLKCIFACTHVELSEIL